MQTVGELHDSVVKHKGLELFFQTNSKKGIQAAHANKLNVLLTNLNIAKTAESMNQPGWNFHILQPRADLMYALKVSGNWRLTFRFTNGNAEIVDYVDYH